MLTRDHTVLPATSGTICLYSPAAQRHRTLADSHCVVTALRLEGWVGLSGCSHTEVVYPLAKAVTHPSRPTNRSQRTVISLIGTNALPPLSPAATYAFRTLQLFNLLSNEGPKATYKLCPERMICDQAGSPGYMRHLYNIHQCAVCPALCQRNKIRLTQCWLAEWYQELMALSTQTRSYRAFYDSNRFWREIIF